MNTNTDFHYLSNHEHSSASLVDIKRIFFRILRNWYIVVLFVGIAVSVAFFKNRYSDRIYLVSTSILIKEQDELSGGKYLYNNPLVNPYRNFLNELYILQSYPLVQKVIEQQNLPVALEKKGSIKATEVYGQLPIRISIKRNGEDYINKFEFKIENRQQFSLSFDDRKENTVVQTFSFGNEFEYGGLLIKVDVLDQERLLSFTNESYTLVYTNPEAVTHQYVSKLKVGWAEEGASVVDLQITGNTPQKEIDFLNALVSNYQKYDLEKKNLAASKSIEFIETQLKNIRDSLRYFEGQLENFKSKNVVTDLSAEAVRLFEKIEGLESQKVEMDLRESYFNYLTEYLHQSNNLDQIILPSTVGLNDGILTELISKMISIQMDIKLFQREAVNPIIVDKQKRVEEIKHDILESIKTLKTTEGIKKNHLLSQINIVEKQLQYLPMAERQLITIKRNYSLLDNLYVFLMQKLAEAGISKASNTSDIIIVNPPRVSGGAILPRVSLNYSIAVLMGILVPLILFLVLEVLNNKIQSREDIEKITNIPFVGGIGHKKQNNNLVVFEQPKSAIAESFRALRSNLNFFTNGKSKKVFMITSSISGEGKTFTTINLATVLAWSGKATCVIGADMRRPKMFKEFNLDNETGLSTYLSGMSSFEETIHPTQITNLWLIGSGPVPPNPSELLLNERMAKLIQLASERFDYIVIDTPPVGLVTDALVLSPFADHSIFLARQNYTPKQMLRTIDDFYKKGTLKNMSILLNDIYKSGPGYGYGANYTYGYGYGYSYGYGAHYTGYYEEGEQGKKQGFLNFRSWFKSS